MTTATQYERLSTEDLVHLLDELGIDLQCLIIAAKYLEQLLEKVLPGQVMKAGPRLPLRR